MKKYIIFILLAAAGRVAAQTETVTLKDLTVPTSPAFVITDISPTLVQNPATPKAFVLGVAQSYQQSGTGFPNNYSAEFTPYWWIKLHGRSVYNAQGIHSAEGKTDKWVENPFSGLKYTSISTAFVNKDMIPDTAKTTQKVFAVGIHTTLLKIHGKGYAQELGGSIARWHSAAQEEIRNYQKMLIELAKLGSDPKDSVERKKIIAKFSQKETPGILENINNLIARKPLFNLDIAGAYSAYGVTDQEARTGRVGAWTTLSSYIPLSTQGDNKNYFEVTASARYLSDHFQKNKQDQIVRADNTDVGGKAGFAFSQLSIGVESLYRHTKGISGGSVRTVGIINVKLAENLYINGAFGKDFAGPNKLISAFGINWGFGKEKVDL
jgi:hypothetical protein